MDECLGSFEGGTGSVGGGIGTMLVTACIWAVIRKDKKKVWESQGSFEATKRQHWGAVKAVLGGQWGILSDSNGAVFGICRMTIVGWLGQTLVHCLAKVRAMLGQLWNSS